MACQPLASEKKWNEAVSPPKNANQGTIAPVDATHDDLEAGIREGDSEEAEVDNNWERLANEYEDLATRVYNYLDDEDGDHADVRGPPAVEPPPTMTREEWERHQITHTHTPYAPGCRHCAAARAVRRKHPKRRKHNIIVPDIDGSDGGPTDVSMDYMYLSEMNTQDNGTPTDPPHLVFIDHRHGGVWAHRVRPKGSLGQAEWVPRRVIQDLANNGMRNIKIHVKTDQEFAVVNLLIAMQDLSPDRTIPVSSPVGESECNGRVEDTVRRVQENMRTLRQQIESSIKCNIPDEAPIMSWLVRWAAELLSTYVVGSDGRTPCERVHKEDCVTPFVQFGKP